MEKFKIEPRIGGKKSSSITTHSVCQEGQIIDQAHSAVARSRWRGRGKDKDKREEFKVLYYMSGQMFMGKKSYERHWCEKFTEKKCIQDIKIQGSIYVECMKVKEGVITDITDKE